MRRNQRQQLRPRHHQIHLVKGHRFARTPHAQVQAEVLLGHDAIVPAAHRSRYSGLTEVLNTIPRKLRRSPRRSMKKKNSLFT
jgi:hypothetical protein